MMEQTARELGIKYTRCGSLVVAFTDEDEKRLEALQERGIENGVSVEMVSADRARQIEPALSEKVKSALYAKDAGIVCPYSLTIAAAENAAANGVMLYLGSRVSGIRFENGAYVIRAGRHIVNARYIVNAAGLYADDVAAMAGAERFVLRPRKGEYVIFDTGDGGACTHGDLRCTVGSRKGRAVCAHRRREYAGRTDRAGH